MAGSQLKKLKESLREAGLTGQTNVKKKGKRSTQKTPNETRRDDRKKVVQGIREQFNTFDTKFNKNKRDTATKTAVGRPSAAKSEAEKERKRAYDALKSRKNKTGGVYDRRFGENDSNMTAEEKMLERFTRERLAQASKRSMYNLEDDDDDMQLTHSGKSLSFGDLDNEEEEDDGGFLTKKRDFEEGDSESEAEVQPGRKKTKAEVMKEVIAKSKFYKHERQLEKQRLEEDIGELDDNFDDVMSELRGVPQEKGPLFSTKSEDNIKYDTAVRSLTLERRAVPADRVKTQEELESEHKAKMEKLEADRKRRMEGMVENADTRADDLEDDFFQGTDEEDEEDEIRLAEDDEEEEELFDSTKITGTNNIKIGGKPESISCPNSLEDMLNLLKDYEILEYPNVIKKVLKTYDPKFGEQNKPKIREFSKVLVDLIVYLTDEGANSEVLEGIISKIKPLVERYPEEMYEKFRSYLLSASTRPDIRKSDLIVFTLVGMTYSTSDQYHLVATPATLLMCEFLETTEIENNRDLFVGVYFATLLVRYQRISQRYIPEVVSFLEKALLKLVPEPEKIESQLLSSTHSKIISTSLTLEEIALPESDKLSLSLLDSRSKSVTQALLSKALSTIDLLIPLWQQFTSFTEIVTPFIAILDHLLTKVESTKINTLHSKLVKLRDVSLAERRPLKLQAHRSIAIASTLPKYEENFNPDKSYDPNRERLEVSKLKAQLKKEQKAALREIRKDSRFIGKQQLDDKRKEMDEYHAKMSKIVNSISTVEGAEKNQYAKEKRRR
ncbi:unnamed protein product [Kuraishia capsulata CBS 1993]|uniref:Nop14-like family protein n=1 Tax=Kuraishia capsulata CBS 1993 TaxID=1382522 RepID=W6MVN5_9ASCO|nr:uncharacterized protein KUCA_T00002367001 [Kuraishia capsulata CBS 1993]CDK26395.1 unnamed protein product [Kuraishia capsulata CBS 1993]